MERGQDRGDDLGLGDQGYDPEAPTAAPQGVDVVDALEEGCPSIRMS